MIMKKKEKILLDIISDKCPITFVKTKIALEKLSPNQILEVHIKKGEALDGLPSSLKELGFKINKKKEIKQNIYALEISR
jgi:TusA-related sulfurtransferase